MKNLALLLALSLTTALVAVAADEKASTQHSSKSNGSMAAEHVVVAPGDIKWADAPPSLPPGAKMAVLEGDPGKKGPFTVRLQMPAGYKIPAHTHPTAERVTVLSGTFHLGTGDKLDETTGQELGAGGFVVMPAGMKHFAWATDETVIQVSSMGPFVINYVDPKDDPRKAKK
jgi:quercetin dioxygenase-like cupin family protein